MKSCCKDAFDNTIVEKSAEKSKFVKRLKYQLASLFGKKKHKLSAHSN